jgi:RNA polymerase sigma-70 factor (ECF subfamily)
VSQIDGELFERHFEPLAKYVRMRVPPADCEDVLSEIFARAWERRTQVRGNPRAWLFTIARSRVAEHFRARSRRMTVETSMTEPPPTGARLDFDALQQLEHEEFRGLLRRKMAVLSERERDVLALKFSDGLTNAAIAEMLDVSRGHLGVLLHRALKRLRDALADGHA